MILEDTFEHFAFDGHSSGLAVQVVILEVALAELFLVYVVAEAIKLVESILVYHLASERQLLIFFVVDHEGSPDLSDLAEILAVLHSY
jgi:hypothetical protein